MLVVVVVAVAREYCILRQLRSCKSLTVGTWKRGVGVRWRQGGRGRSSGEGEKGEETRNPKLPLTKTRIPPNP